MEFVNRYLSIFRIEISWNCTNTHRFPNRKLNVIVCLLVRRCKIKTSAKIESTKAAIQVNRRDVCSYAKADYSRFMNTTARIALHLIPEEFKDQPVFLCIDDTMVSKFGMKFENVSKLFDHAAHNGSSYLNGHCFVSIMFCIPVKNHDHIIYKVVKWCNHLYRNGK